MSRGAALGWLMASIPLTALSAILPKLADQPGATTAFWRFATALALALAVGSVTRHRPRTPPAGPRAHPGAWRLSAAAGAAIGVDLCMWNQALLEVSAAEAMLLGQTAPLWVGLFAWGCFGRVPGRAHWLACALAAAGMALFVAHRLGAAPSSTEGLVLCVAAGAFYGAYILLAHAARERIGVSGFMAISQASAAAVCLVAALAWQAPLIGFGPSTWAWLLSSGVVGFAGTWALARAVAGFSPESVSLALTAQVPTAGVIAWVALDERLVGAQALGAIVMLAAVVLAARLPTAPIGARPDRAVAAKTMGRLGRRER